MSGDCIGGVIVGSGGFELRGKAFSAFSWIIFSNSVLHLVSG